MSEESAQDLYEIGQLTAMQGDPIATFWHRPNHYFAVDLLRGFAAIAVLFYHYQHFYYAPGAYNANVRDLSEQLPMFEFFSLIYIYGSYAVQFFWMISGFVFASVYSSKYTSANEFFMKRIARLYPLHLLTLIVVAVLQAIACSTFGTNLIYENNDGYHFMLNLVLASSWGFENGYSFNAPIWSVSVEVIIYALFWLVSKPLLQTGMARPLAIASVAGMLFQLGLGNWMIWECAMYFFIGCVIYNIAGNHRNPVRDLAIMVVACVAILVCTDILAELTVRAGFLLFAVALVGCATIVDSHRLGRVFERVRFIGDSTYGIYLWHIPIQLMALLLLNQFGFDPEVRNSPAFLLLFLTTCCVVGWLSFTIFERPLNRSILRWWNLRQEGRRKAATTP
jgi:peptidoglycan/LPS O-acetylase OafA/YrhL